MSKWLELLILMAALGLAFFLGWDKGKRGADHWYAEHPKFVICQDGTAALEAAAVGIRRDNGIVQIPQGCIGIEP